MGLVQMKKKIFYQIYIKIDLNIIYKFLLKYIFIKKCLMKK